jgi:hypothetical protein
MLLLLLPALAAEDPFGVWAPGDGSPITAAVSARVPQDGAVCIEDAVQRASRDVRFELDQLTTGATMELDRYKEPFALCMVEKGWHRVDADEMVALRVLGEIEDCRKRIQATCAGAVTQYVHGTVGSRLEPKKGMEVVSQLCDAGDTQVCLTGASLALHPPEDRGLAPDARLALSLTSRGCEKGEAEACAFAGVLLSTGAAGVTKDTSRGAKYLSRACAAGIGSACNWPNGTAVAVIDAALPPEAQWCRYGAVTKSNPACADAPVAWIAASSAGSCAPQVTVAVGTCTYAYRLGR